VARQPLESKVLCTFPGFDRDPPATGEIGDHKGIYTVILRKIDIGFLVVLN
jgi:hypothetical protein